MSLAITQVSAPAAVICLSGLILVVGVVLPAVWCRRSIRRKAALDVLDRLTRFLRPRP
jgi:hypothetical protein